MATEHAKQAQTKSKVWYDRHARERSFQVEQLFLVLLPGSGKPLETKYQGPFRIIGKLGPVDYVISTPNKRRSQRVCHVNLLKEYVERDAKFLCLNTDVSEVSDVGQLCLKHKITFLWITNEKEIVLNLSRYSESLETSLVTNLAKQT